MVIPVVITVYRTSRSLSSPSRHALPSCSESRRHRRRARNAEQGKVGKVTRKQVLDIVKVELKDMNATNEEAAFRVISGTARSMGIEVVE